MTNEWQAEVVTALAEVVEVLAQDLASLEAVLVDVREPEEYVMGKIAGAIDLPMSLFKALAAERLPTDKKLIFYCAGGVRSAVAAMWAKRMGFAAVYSLHGGFKAWLPGTDSNRRPSD
jgi:rhodanese-related sulfurtransferase